MSISECGDCVKGTAGRAHELSVFYTNSRSVINKIDILRGIACVEELDIIGITETWLDIAGKHFLPEVGIDGYTIFFTRIEKVGEGKHIK